MRHQDYNPDGIGARPHPVHDMAPAMSNDYWDAVTDVPCPVCKTGTIRWAEAGYVPGYRICDGCGRHFMAEGSAEAPTLIQLKRQSRV